MATQPLNMQSCTLSRSCLAATGFERTWYAIFTRSHHEKRVAQHYTERQIEHYLPLYQTVHQWTHARKATLHLPLFPNYVFVHVSREERTRTLQVPGVLSFVSQSNVPAPLPRHEIEAMRSGLHLKTFEPHPCLVAGTRVRITTGALAGIEGVVLRNKNTCRVVLTLALIQRSVAVEVNASDLETLN